MEGRPGPQAVPHFIQALIEKVLLGDTDAMSLLAAGTTPHARWHFISPCFAWKARHCGSLVVLSSR